MNTRTPLPSHATLNPLPLSQNGTHHLTLHTASTPSETIPCLLVDKPIVYTKRETTMRRLQFSQKLVDHNAAIIRLQ